MENILERSQHDGAYFWVEIPDVGGGAVKLYLLNDGTQPPTPLTGDFAYDFKNSTVQVYDNDNWRTVTIRDVESRVWNPIGNGSIVSFTHRGLPFWTSADQHDGACEFHTIEDLLRSFREGTDPAKVQMGVSERSSEC